jgi:hypothetical protein
MYAQAIHTKYLGPTNSKQSRISVMRDGKRKMYNWDDSVDTDMNHRLACHAYIRDCNMWNGAPYQIVSHSDNKSGYIFHVAMI